MARGSTTFSNLFGEDYNLDVPEKQTKGRSASFIEIRNDLLLHRYYYYGQFTEKRFEVITAHLEQEFHLSSRTIQDIITASLHQIKKIKATAPTIKQLRKEFPWMVW